MFYGDTPVEFDLQQTAANIITFGLATTIGNGSETPPDPRTQSGDVAPPTQRWIYWETRAPIVTALSADAGIATWRDSGSTEPTDTKAQVLAQGLPGGDTLNLWAIWRPALGWDPAGSFALSLGISMLVDEH